MSPQIAIVLYPIGPACCIRTDQGQLLRGFRVPDDHPGPDVVYRGHPVRFRLVSKDGTVLIDGDGRQQWGSSANGKSLLTIEPGCRREVRDVAAPELRGPIERGSKA